MILPPRIADYRCLVCSYEWTWECKPVECPSCGGLQVKWLNFDELRDSGRINK